MFEMVKFPYNARAIARLDKNNVVHNHLYHNCPIGSVSENMVFDSNKKPVGRVDSDGTIHCHHENNSPIGKIDSNGYVSKNNNLVGRIEGNSFIAGAAYLLLINDNR